ncbi:MAG TPA: acetyl-CoA carboxylase biotin carboxyl carrier protein [Terriglobales bacterium]|nr:acetyl-CoA carboxylase biotin carboxyl carrier protein [Terriglobales bacterium]
MNQKELKELIEFIIEKGIAEFELERGDVKVKIKRASEAPPAAVPDSRYIALHPAQGAVATHISASAPAQVELAAAATPVPEPEEDLHIVRSPIVGTFYEAPSPGAPPFVKVGDAVEIGQVLCIVEAMKLMNEIECDVAGEVVKKLVANGQPIEYGQELFSIRPKK